MQTTEFLFNNKKLAMLSIGCMRFDGREQACELIRYCVQNGALFLDTSPMYCFKSEEENNETWVGSAIKGIREQVILSAKCSPGNGGDGIGEYDKAHGFSITTADQVRAEIEQSLKRLDVDYFDVYQLWTVSNMLVYKEAFKKGGWMEGVMKAKEEGLFKHLGMTTHSGNDFIKMAADEGIFETITAPFHIMDNSRLDGFLYAMEKNIAMVAMNPLAGGTLRDSADLALRYINAYGITALAGMSNIEQAKINIEIMQKPVLKTEQAESLRKGFLQMVDAGKFKCTSCGYCMPCPQDINIPEVFKLWNQVNVLGLSESSPALGKVSAQNENCTKCRECEKKCPNQLKIIKMLDIVNSEI